jgi:LemA protein
MRSRAIIGSIALAVTAVVCAWVVDHALQVEEEFVAASWSDVRSAMQRRAELARELVTAVQRASHRDDRALDDILDARERFLAARSPAEFAAADAALSEALARSARTLEEHRELYAARAFHALEGMLACTEDHIAAARARYNALARAYNASLARFPARLVATLLGHTEKAVLPAATVAAG